MHFVKSTELDTFHHTAITGQPFTDLLLPENIVTISGLMRGLRLREKKKKRAVRVSVMIIVPDALLGQSK